MTKYKRNWNCAVCDKPVIYDTLTKEVTCGCDPVIRDIPPLVLELYFTEIKECVRKKQKV